MKDQLFFFEKLNLVQLRQRNKLLGLKNYSKYKKTDLVYNIIRFLYARKIQRWFRKKMSFSETCAISLSKVRYPCWPFKVQKGWFHYNLPELVDYFLISGDFREPQSKREITTMELEKLDEFVKKVGLHKNSLSVAKKNTSHYKKLKNNEDYRDALVEEIRDIFCVIRDRLDSNENAIEINFNLELVYLPALRNYIKELYRYSKKYLKVSIRNSIGLIESVKFNTFGSRSNLQQYIIKWLKNEETKYFKI